MGIMVILASRHEAGHTELMGLNGGEAGSNLATLARYDKPFTMMATLASPACQALPPRYMLGSQTRIGMFSQQ